MHFTRSFLRSALLALLPALLLGGCVGRPNLNEIDKAKLIKEKRREAQDVLAKFKASGQEDLDLLMRYNDLHRETTEIAPSTCPRCWASYGEALSMVGWYYYQIQNEALEEAETAKASEKRKLLQEAEDYKGQWEKFFTLSNQAYETHFRSRDVPAVHPFSYERVMRHYEVMENYERALYYLQKYLESYGTELEEPSRQKVEKLRRLYRQELQRQKERGVKTEDHPVRKKAAAPKRPSPPRQTRDDDDY